jgi:DNA modification methylase
MGDMQSESIDMVLTDPPYGTSACKWDVVIPLHEMWQQLERVIKPQGAIVLFGSEPFSSVLRTSNLALYKYDWKWEKPNAANFLNFKYQPAKVHEDIMVFGQMATSYSKRGNMVYNPQMEAGEPYRQRSGKQRYDYGNSSVRTPIEQVVTDNKGTRYPRSVIKFGPDKEKYHPTQKPVALLEYLIQTYTQPGDTVLDFTMGSGSTGVACANTDRLFVGIEIDQGYFDVASKRIQDAFNNQQRGVMG